jgi:hypothetical protein
MSGVPGVSGKWVGSFFLRCGLSRSKRGTPVQNTISDGDGNAVGHFDFKDHGTGGPHGHVFDVPGIPSGHGPGAPHIPAVNLPPGWDLKP